MALWVYHQLEKEPGINKTKLFRKTGALIGRTWKAVEAKVQNFASCAPPKSRPIAPLDNAQEDVRILFKSYWPDRMSEVDSIYPELVAHFRSQPPAPASTQAAALQAKAKNAAFTVLSTAEEIAAAQEELELVIKEGSPVHSRVLSNRGGQAEAEVYTFEPGIWAAFLRESNRFWNAFGVSQDPVKRQWSITCEVNPPYDEIDRKIAGCFLVDSNGDLWLAHRGRIGGGREGIGKALFMEQYRGYWVAALDGSRISSVVPIGRLSDRRFRYHLATFVRTVDQIKQGVPVTKRDDPWYEPKPTYKPEYGKSYNYTASGKLTVDRKHGRVIQALYSALKASGHEVGNDQERDLYVVDKGVCTILFEAKTRTDTQSIYTAVGQLFYHGRNDERMSPSRVLVVPDTLSTNQNDRLRELGIIVLRYKWAKGLPKFLWPSPSAFMNGIEEN